MSGRLAAFVCLALLLSPAVGGEELRRRIGPLTLAAPPMLSAQLEELAADAEAILPALQKRLGVEPAAPFLIFLIPPGGPEERHLRYLDASAPEWAAGYMFSQNRVGAVRMGQADRYPYSDPRSVLAHEMIHVLLHDAVGGKLPRWFEEGVASFESLRWGWRDRWVLSASVVAGAPPRFSDLDLSFSTSAAAARTAYAVSFDFVRWASGRYGEDLVPRLLAEIPARGFRDAWHEVTREDLAESEADWRRGVTWGYRWIPLLTASSSIWIAVTGLALLAGWRKRARRRELEEEWGGLEGPRPSEDWSVSSPLEEPEDDDLIN